MSAENVAKRLMLLVPKIPLNAALPVRPTNRNIVIAPTNVCVLQTLELYHRMFLRSTPLDHEIHHNTMMPHSNRNKGYLGMWNISSIKLAQWGQHQVSCCLSISHFGHCLPRAKLNLKLFYLNFYRHISTYLTRSFLYQSQVTDLVHIIFCECKQDQMQIIQL